MCFKLNANKSYMFRFVIFLMTLKTPLERLIVSGEELGNDRMKFFPQPSTSEESEEGLSYEQNFIIEPRQTNRTDFEESLINIQHQENELNESKYDFLFGANEEDGENLGAEEGQDRVGRLKEIKRKFGNGVESQDEKLLLNYLMMGYESDVRPVRNGSKPVVIEVGITLTQIFDMDEKNQVLTTNVWLDQEWYDELLEWDPKDFGGLKKIRLPCDRIWLPDIVLYNNADDYTRGYFPSRAMVSYDGKVFWPPPTKFRSSCPVDVTYFPFDDQICTMKLGSWTYNGFEVDVMNRTKEVDLSNYIPNGEWELLEAELHRNVVYYSCCPEPFPDVTITLIIRRKTLYYIYNILLPCMMLSVLTLLVFCLPPDSGEKIALGVTVLLAFSVFMLAIAEKMPETSESIPLIGVYLTAVMAITSVSIISTIIVLNLHYVGPRLKPIPKWLRFFLSKEEGRIVRESFLMPITKRSPGKLKRSLVFITQKASENNSSPPRVSEIHEHEIIDEVVGEKRPGPSVDFECNNASNTSGVRRPISMKRKNPICSDEEINSQELLKTIQKLVEKEEEIEEQNYLLAQWRIVAAGVDRILFWLFTLVTLVSSVIFLLALPFYKRSFNGPYHRNR